VRGGQKHRRSGQFDFSGSIALYGSLRERMRSEEAYLEVL